MDGIAWIEESEVTADGTALSGKKTRCDRNKPPEA